MSDRVLWVLGLCQAKLRLVRIVPSLFVVYSYFVRSQNGFTIIELMVAVAVVGILAVAATSAYDSFVDRARMSEAKAQLSNLFATQAIYRVEHDQYTTRLDVLGFEAKGKLSYDYGFSVDIAPPATSFQGTPNCNNLCQGSGCTAAYRSTYTCTPYANTGLDSSAACGAATASAFLACAHSHLDGRNPSSRPSSFTVDQNKVIRALANPN